MDHDTAIERWTFFSMCMLGLLNEFVGVPGLYVYICIYIFTYSIYTLLYMAFYTLCIPICFPICIKYIFYKARYMYICMYLHIDTD